MNGGAARRRLFCADFTLAIACGAASSKAGTQFASSDRFAAKKNHSASGAFGVDISKSRD
jgi:hypothetical protein